MLEALPSHHYCFASSLTFKPSTAPTSSLPIQSYMDGDGDHWTEYIKKNLVLILSIGVNVCRGFYMEIDVDDGYKKKAQKMVT